MTEYLDKDIFSIVDNGNVLVMPTEESARAFLKCYVKSRHKGILASSIISFDSFASLFIPQDGKRAADDFHRLIFSEAFVSNEADKLVYFYNPEYPEMKENLSSFILSMLPTLNEAFEKEIKKKELYHDLFIIMNSYREFLEKHSLVEMGWALYEDRELDKDYYLFESNAFPKEQKLLKVIKDNKRVHEVNSAKSSSSLSVYKNEAIEIRSLFQNIRQLIDKGVSYNDIAISSSALTRIRPYLEREALLFNVPLNFIPGLAVKNTPPGRFLLSLRELYQKSYRIEDMKRFFLDPAFPFKDKDQIFQFITKSIALSVKSARAGQEDRYRKIDNAFYPKFRSTLDALMKEKHIDRVSFRYENLVALLFGDERFLNSDINDKVYGFVIDAMTRFLAEARELSENLEKPVFQIFLNYVENLQYTPREKVKGINVYPFTEAAATPYLHHFLISLNEAESAKRIREASFLSEYEREAFSDEEITDYLLASYQATSDNIYYSASEETYNGYALPLVSLMENSNRIGKIDVDQYQNELSGAEMKFIYPLQKEGHDRALKTSLKSNRINEDVKGIRLDYPSLSYTAVSEYTKCPYRYALKYAYGLNRSQPFDIVLVDDFEIGTRLHSIFERFFRNKEKDKDRIEIYFEEEMDAWRNGKRFDKNGNLKAMEFGSASATESLILYLRHEYLENLKIVAAQILSESNQIEDGNEVYFTSDFDGKYRLSGKADMVTYSKEDGDIIVYDFKKGKKFQKNVLAEKKMQFSIYNMLIEKDKRFEGKSVSKGIFETLRDAQSQCAWAKENDGSEISVRNDKELIESVADGIREGLWPMASDKDECKGCDFKGICRRKYVVR